MLTDDYTIRTTLRKQLSDEFSYDPGTLILDELGVCQGAARVDMAVVNGSLNGYEIKSDIDTLERLPSQREYYSKVFDKMVIVIGEKHLDLIYSKIPEWWGIVVVSLNKDNKLKFISCREGNFNKDVDSYAIAQLLWKEEALDILREYDLHKGVLSKTRDIIWRRLADNLPQQELKDLVRQTIKTRINWRADQSLELYGD